MRGVMARSSRTRRALKWLATCLSLEIPVLFLRDIEILSQAPRPVPLDKIAGYGITFVLALASAIYLWSKDRPYPAGHCQFCNYNLTGNVSGICPECGLRAP